MLWFYIYTRSYQLLFIDAIKKNFLFGPIVCECSYLLIYVFSYLT